MCVRALARAYVCVWMSRENKAEIHIPFKESFSLFSVISRENHQNSEFHLTVQWDWQTGLDRDAGNGGDWRLSLCLSACASGGVETAIFPPDGVVSGTFHQVIDRVSRTFALSGIWHIARNFGILHHCAQKMAAMTSRIEPSGRVKVLESHWCSCW